MMNRILTATLAVACFTLAIVIALSNSRPRVGGTASIVQPTTQDLRGDHDALLDTYVGNVRFDDMRLDDALQALAKQSGVNILPEWQTLDPAGITRTTRLNLHLNDGTLRQALYQLLPGNPADRFAQGPLYVCIVQDGNVIITTPAGASAHTVTEYINVHPLLKEIGDSYRALSDHFQNPPADPNAPPGERLGPMHTDAIDSVVKLITDMVAPESWRDSGGTIGSLREIGGVLVITQTRENLRAIHQLLDRLRRAVQGKDSVALPIMAPAVGPTPPATASTATQPAVEFVDIRKLVDELRMGWGWRTSNRPNDDVQTPEDIIKSIKKLIEETIEADTWRSNGGTIGTMSEVGGVLVITHTPGTVREIRGLVSELRKATLRNDFPPATRPVPITQPGTRVSNVPPAGVGVGPIIVCFNIRPLMIGLDAGKPVSTPLGREPGASARDAVWLIRDHLIDTIARSSWQQHGGTARLQEIGGILVVRQTPENIATVRIALEQLNGAIARHEFPPSDAPPAPKQESNNQR